MFLYSFPQLSAHWTPWTLTWSRGGLCASCGRSVIRHWERAVWETSLSKILTSPSTTRLCTTLSLPLETSCHARYKKKTSSKLPLVSKAVFTHNTTTTQKGLNLQQGDGQPSFLWYSIVNAGVICMCVLCKCPTVVWTNRSITLQVYVNNHKKKWYLEFGSVSLCS